MTALAQRLAEDTSWLGIIHEEMITLANIAAEQVQRAEAAETVLAAAMVEIDQLCSALDSADGGPGR